MIIIRDKEGSTTLIWVLAIMILMNVIGLIVEWCYTPELQCYSVDMEIVNKSDCNARQFFYLCNNDKTITVAVDQPTFESYSEGEWVKIEFQTCEHPISHEIIEYVVAIEPTENLP